MKEKRKYTFSRWIKHLYYFNKVAIKLKVWRPRHLLHDIDKPFKNLIMSNKEVHIIHNLTNKHHIMYVDPDKINYTDMVIDWECARFTKKDKPLTADLTFMNYVYGSYDIDTKIKIKIVKELKRLNLMNRVDANLAINILNKLK